MEPSKSYPSKTMELTDLSRVFNSAVLSSRAASLANQAEGLGPSIGLREVMASPAFRSILTAVQLHAQSQGMSEKEAAEQIIEAFRKLDQLWFESVFQEGLNKLKNSAS